MIKSRKDEVGGACSMRGGDKWEQNFGLKAWKKEQLERPWRKWKDDIKMDFKEMG
jgi:hypothetical protein